MCVYTYMYICVWIYLQVRGFAAGGPAERSGKIEVGHILVQVDGTTVRGLQYPELAQVRVGFQNVFCISASGIVCIFAHPTYTCLQYPELAGSCRVSECLLYQNVFCILVQGIICIFAHPTNTCLQYPDLASSWVS